MKNKWLFVFLVVALGSCFSNYGYTHTLWLNVSDFSPQIPSPEYGAETKVYFGYGHHYPVDDFLPQEELEEFSLITPAGEKENLTPNQGGFLATVVRCKQEGGYIVSTIKKPGFYTMYVEKGKIHHNPGLKTGIKQVILSHYYEQYAKALINVGKPVDDAFLNPVGHKLEIIPLKNPGNLKGCGGHFLPVKVLFEGEPARFCQVLATYSGFSTNDDFAYATTTDSQGIARIRLINRGYWLVKVNIKLPASEKLKDKCNELSYTATLTFEIP